MCLLRYRFAPLSVVLPFRDRLAFEFGHHQETFERLGEGWDVLWRKEVISFAVVERTAAGGGYQLVAHGASVFLSDEMADALPSRPFAAAQVIREALSGGDGILGIDQIRQAHGEGSLNLLLLHAQYFESPTGAIGESEVYEILARSFFEHHRGYRIRQCFIEAFCPLALKHHLGSGLLVRAKHQGEEPSLEKPWLLGVSREESRENPGARIASLFVDYPIRLGLRRTHREVLSMALLGLVDEEIAEELCLSPSAIKRRWESIYETVDANGPGLTWESGPQLAAVRGPERRRHLLNFLREHPEELRPIAD